MIDIALFQGIPIWVLGTIFSLFAGLATGIGALVMFFIKSDRLKHQDALLAFAAGAMLFVIAGEIIPESHKAEDTRLVTLSVLIGFCVMLFLDIALG